MMSFWISVVPSGMVIMRALRNSNSTPKSLVMPLPPWICTALEATSTAISVA